MNVFVPSGISTEQQQFSAKSCVLRIMMANIVHLGLFCSIRFNSS